MQDAMMARETVSALVLENISKVQSFDKETREGAEKTLKTLEISQGYGSTLVILVLQSGLEEASRQMASVLLKQFVEAHWSTHGEKFTSFQVEASEKAHIRDSLLVGLRDPLKKIRASVAYTISLIASFDWPDEWPMLFDILVSGLASRDSVFVHGAMRVLAEFCREIDDKQVDAVLPLLLPHLIHILLNHHDYGLRTRSRSVSIFTTCSNLIRNMRAVHMGAAKKHLSPHLATLVQAFCSLLLMQDGDVSDRGLKAEIINALICLMSSFPSLMKPHGASVLSSVWCLLTRYALQYTEEVVNNSENLDESVDSDCEMLGYSGVTEALFEFIQTLLEMPRMRCKVEASSTELFKFIIMFMQITHEQAERWMEDGQEWLQEEETASYKNSTRISAKELLSSIFELFPRTSTSSLHSCAMQMFADADARKSQGDPNWWKLYEATLLAVGDNSSSILVNNNNKNNNNDNNNINNNASNSNADSSSFDVEGLMKGVVMPLLTQDVPVYLTGRLLWLSSKFASVLSKEVMEHVLQMTLSCFSASHPSFLHLQALLSIQQHSIHMAQANNNNSSNNPPNHNNNNNNNINPHNNNNNNDEWLRQHVRRMVAVVVAIAMDDDVRVLETCLSTLCTLLEVDEWVTGVVGEECSSLVLAVFNKYDKDAMMMTLCQDVLLSLAGNKACVEALQHKLLPFLTSTLQLPSNADNYGMQAICVELVTSLIRHGSSPLPASFFTHAFPAVLHCIINSPDFSTLENGADCMRAYVSKDLDGLLKWTDQEGRTSGVAHVMRVVERLLDPKTPEFTASFAGRLIRVMLARMVDVLGEHVGVLLKAVLIKLTQAQTFSTIQSLVLVFAHLMHSQLHAVVDFLSSVPGPSGKSALDFVLTEWTGKLHLFVGDYERKVSSVALCKLLEYSVGRNDERLASIQVRGEQVFAKEAGVRTRSRTSIEPDQWTQVPVLVKIYKLLISELSHQIELNRCRLLEQRDDAERGDEGDDNDDGENEDDDEEEEEEEAGVNIFEDYLDNELDGEDVVEDDDVKDDPISKINLQEYLVSFLQSLSHQPFFSFFSRHNNTLENQVLSSIGIEI